MSDLIEKCIDLRIDIILNEFNFEKRRKEHPEECPCNGTGPCHDTKDLNCFFCYCPFYENDKLEGGCGIKNLLEKGKWFYRIGHQTSDMIWDCSECDYPHQEKNVRIILKELFKGELYKIQHNNP